MIKYKRCKKIRLVAIFIVSLSMMIGCSSQQKATVSVPEFVFSYADNQSVNYPTTVGARKFAELVEERTKGRIKILVQAEGVLGDEKQVLEQLQFGGIDFARISLSQLSSLISMYSILQLPYLYRDTKHMWRVLDGEIGDYFLQVAEGSNVVALSWYDAGARNFYNSVRPITKLEDLKGLKIRVQESELMASILEALGATPMQIAYDQVYSCLERGVIDGAENNWASYESTGHSKVAKYYTVDEHTRVPELQLCAKATWEKLSPEDQVIISQCAKESALYERELWVEKEKEAQKRVLEQGVLITKLAEEEKERFKEAVQGIYEQYEGEEMRIIKKIVALGE